MNIDEYKMCSSALEVMWEEYKRRGMKKLMTVSHIPEPIWCCGVRHQLSVIVKIEPVPDGTGSDEPQADHGKVG